MTTERRTTGERIAADSPTPAYPPMPPSAPRVSRPSDATREGRGATARSRAEAHEMHETARDAWIAAMRAAGSGRPADLAALAIVQEAYEAAAAERDRWDASGGRMNIPIEPETRSPVDAVVGQELAWREVRAPRREPGFVGRLLRRLRR